MMADMQRLVDQHCEDSAVIVEPDLIKCLWCNELIRCPPYRPHGYFLRGTSAEGAFRPHPPADPPPRTRP